MTATGHALIGTVIAIKIGDPRLAVPIAIVSHAVADYVPHWDTAVNTKAKGKTATIIHSAIDGVFSYIASYIFILLFSPQTNIPYAFMIVFSAQLFDWVTVPYYFFNVKAFKFFYNLQKYFDKPFNNPLGILTQAAVVAGVIAIAWILKP